MQDNSEAGVIRSYRATLEAFSNLVSITEGLVSAHRAGRHPSDEDVAHVEQQLGYATAKIVEIDRFLALWPDGDGQVH